MHATPARAQNTATQAPAAQNSVVIADNGLPKAVIVLPDIAGRNLDSITQVMVTQAGLQLGEYLRRMTGATFKTVHAADLGEVKIDGTRLTSAKVPADSYILVGESDITRSLKIAPALEPGDMYIKAAGNVLALTGPQDGQMYSGGTLYAVHHFVESLGVRYLWPGELGLAVPERKSIAVPYGTEFHSPIIKQRTMRMIGGSPRALEGAKDLGLDGDYSKMLVAAGAIKVPYVTRNLGGWLEWQNVGGDRGISGGHSFGDLWSRFGTTHPGWFALQPDGTRNQKTTDRAQLCLSNSEVVQQVANDIIAKADANPKLLSVPLAPNDGGAEAFCMCKVNALGEPGCTTYDPPQGRKIHLWGWDKDYVSLTDRYITFCNRVADIVAAKHPKLLMVVDAYSLYASPPVATTLRPNLVVRYVPSTMDDWDGWSAKASKIYWRPNTLSAPWRVGELKFNRDYAKDLGYAAHHSAIATDFDSILNSWATEGLNYYVLAKLNWDPDAKVDDLVAEYCQAGFRPAAGEIRSYFKKVGDLTGTREAEMYSRLQAGPDKVTLHVRPDTLTEFYTPKLMAELSGLLDAAAKKAGGPGAENENIRRRIEFLRVGLDWTDMQTRAYKMLIAWTKKQPVDLVAAAKLLEERRAMERKIFTDNPLAVNVAYINYGDRGWWDALQKAIVAAGAAAAPADKPGNTMIDADENGHPIVVPKL